MVTGGGTGGGGGGFWAGGGAELPPPPPQAASVNADSATATPAPAPAPALDDSSGRSPCVRPSFSSSVTRPLVWRVTVAYGRKPPQMSPFRSAVRVGKIRLSETRIAHETSDQTAPRTTAACRPADTGGMAHGPRGAARHEQRGDRTAPWSQSERGEISHGQCAGEVEPAQSARAQGLVSRAAGQCAGGKEERGDSLEAGSNRPDRPLGERHPGVREMVSRGAGSA